VAPADKMFFTKAAIGGMTEVQAGQLAEEKGTTDEVKAFGKKMVDDHTEAGDKLKALAESKSVTLPAALDAKHQATIAQLNATSGPAFDTAFEQAMKKGHADTIALFQKAAKSSDADVASFATSTLPTLKSHAATIPGIDHSKM
jgi:putative membrane protein